MRPRDGGLCRQVVLIQRCMSITEEVHGAAYNGHCRQVSRVVLLHVRPLKFLSANITMFIEHVMS